MKFKTLAITCPSCHQKGKLPVFDVIDLGESSEATRAAVLSGRIFIFECPHCHRREPVSYPLTCFDDETNSIIVVLDEDNRVEHYRNAFNTFEELLEHENGTYRIVDTCQEMSEKLRILSDKLDDRVVELMKMTVREIVLDDDMKNYAQVKCIYKNLEDGKINLIVRYDGEKGDIDIPTSEYANIEKTLNELPSIELKDNYVINFTWADKMIAEITIYKDKQIQL